MMMVIMITMMKDDKGKLQKKEIEFPELQDTCPVLTAVCQLPVTLTGSRCTSTVSQLV
jgi:hypothetical protein